MTDDELFELLKGVFRPRQGDMPHHAVVALHRAVAARSQRPATPPRGRKLRWAYAGVALSLALGSGAAYGAVKGIPEPVRNAAHRIGLPVTSTAVIELHSAEQRLGAALGRGDSIAAAREANVVRQQLAELPGGEREREEPAAHALLEQEEGLAVAPSVPAPPPAGPTSTENESPPPTTNSPAGTVTSPNERPTATTEPDSPPSAVQPSVTTIPPASSADNSAGTAPAAPATTEPD
jgi:hypothetical protein